MTDNKSLERAVEVFQHGTGALREFALAPKSLQLPDGNISPRPVRFSTGTVRKHKAKKRRKS